jgi:4-amino-4-deoxy-L-arabinose transferase-like glycosyltransferase
VETREGRSKRWYWLSGRRSPLDLQRSLGSGGKEPPWRRLALPALLTALAVPLLFLGLGDYGLVNGDEGFYHYIARRMLRTGDWFRLEFTGEHRLYDTLTHAPLFLWSKALLIGAFGDSYWTMRGLSAACALLSVLATYRLTSYAANRRAGFLAAVIQLTTYQFMYLHGARTGEMEPVLSLLFTLSAYTLLRAVETERSFVAHHLCLVALLNLKLGFVVVPLLAAGIQFALRGEMRGRFAAWLLQGALIVPLGLAWHVYQVVHLELPLIATLQTMFDQAAGIGAGTQHLKMSANIRFYASTLFHGAFPYVLIYPFAVLGLLRASGSEQRKRWQLLASYVVAIAVFITVVSFHHAWYVIPLYPFLSAFAGAWLEGLSRRSLRAPTLWAISFALALGAWTRFAIFDCNPFAGQAIFVPASWAWAHLGPAGPGLGVSLTGLCLGLALFSCGRVLPEPRYSRAFAAVLAAGLLGFGALRVLTPFRFISHVSPMETLHLELERAKAGKERIDYPVPVPGRGILKVRYFFADEYDVRRSPPGVKPLRRGSYVLYERQE